MRRVGLNWTCFFVYKSVAILVGLLCADAWAKEGPPKSVAMAEKLAVLRTEINDLDASLRSRRNLASTELRSLQMRVNELALAKDTERIKVQTLKAEVVELEASVGYEDERSASLQSAVLTAIDQLRKLVVQGLPFKQAQRLDTLVQIGQDLQSNKADATASAARVWRFVQDEQRLASTVELADVSIVLGHKKTPTLVRVVRVGTVAMFVHAGQNRWGSVVRGPNDTFSYFDVKNHESNNEIRRLFESVEKQILEGRYRLPLFQIGESK